MKSLRALFRLEGDTGSRFDSPYGVNPSLAHPIQIVMAYRTPLKLRLLVISACFLMSTCVLSATTATQVAKSDNPISPPRYGVSEAPLRLPAFDYHSNPQLQINFDGNWLAPKARGQATAFNSPDGVEIEFHSKDLHAADQIGPAFLTYVLWAVSQDGVFHNLGELMINGSNGTLVATTKLESFAMLVTAEPYFAVTEPSGVVVLRNTVPRGALPYRLTPALLPLLRDEGTPLHLVQARNAVRIIRRLGVQRAAPEELEKAVQLLSEAEEHYRNDRETQAIHTARKAVEAAETARVYALRDQSEPLSP